MMSWSKVATFIESRMLLNKRQYNQTIHQSVVFVSQPSDSWKFDGDPRHFCDKFMYVWDLTSFSSAKIYILFSCVLFVRCDVSVSTAPCFEDSATPQFSCILKLQTPGCSQNSLTGNKIGRCHRPEDHIVLTNEVLLFFIFNTFFLTLWPWNWTFK